MQAGGHSHINNRGCCARKDPRGIDLGQKQGGKYEYISAAGVGRPDGVGGPNVRGAVICGRAPIDR